MSTTLNYLEITKDSIVEKTDLFYNESSTDQSMYYATHYTLLVNYYKV